VTKLVFASSTMHCSAKSAQICARKRRFQQLLTWLVNLSRSFRLVPHDMPKNALTLVATVSGVHTAWACKNIQSAESKLISSSNDREEPAVSENEKISVDLWNTRTETRIKFLIIVFNYSINRGNNRHKYIKTGWIWEIWR